MRRLWGQCSPILAGALWVAAPGSAAASDVVAAHIEYAAHTECPDQSDFARRLLGRTRRIELAPREQASWQFTVFVFRQGSGSRGILRVVDATGQASERSVTAATCDEVVSALALVAALTVDPEAAEPEAPARQAPSPAGAPVPARRSAGAPVPSRSPPAARTPSARPNAPHAHILVSAGAELELNWALAPKPMLVERAFAEVERQAPGSMLPALRLGVARGASSSNEFSAPVWMSYTSARLEALVAWDPIPGLALRPGAFIDGGSLTGETSGSAAVAGSGPQTRLWFSAGLIGRASWQPARPLLLELFAAGFAPFFSEDRFTLPDEVVHKIPDVSGFIGAGIGVSTR